MSTRVSLLLLSIVNTFDTSVLTLARIEPDARVPALSTSNLTFIPFAREKGLVTLSRVTDDNKGKVRAMVIARCDLTLWWSRRFVHARPRDTQRGTVQNVARTGAQSSPSCKEYLNTNGVAR